MKFLLPILSYFLGAVPFGLLISKNFYQIDIREHGSKNPGATNVWRVLGKKPGMITLTLDILKGVIPVVIAKSFDSSDEILFVVCGVAAIIGHNWSLFLRGKGGKGVATSAGVFLAIMPLQAVVALTVFCILFFSTGYVSVGSIGGAITLFITTFFFQTSDFLRLIIILAATMLIIKHIPNIKRLLNGSELKVKFK